MILQINWSEYLKQIIAGLIVAVVCAVAGLFWRRGLHEFVKSLPGRLRLTTKRLVAHWRCLCIVALLVLFEMAVYRVSLDWMIVTLSTAHLALIAVTARLLTPVRKTTGVWAPYRRSPIVFTDDFTGDLRANWDVTGAWQISPNGTLVVTNSHFGGISKTGALWENYTFEFQAKIVNECLGVIVRAQDLGNYHMFQIRPDRIVPCLLVPVLKLVTDTAAQSGDPQYKIVSRPQWDIRSAVPLDRRLKDWFDARVIVRGQSVQLCIDDNMVFESELLLANPTGKVGFRNHGHERAFIKYAKVTLEP